MKKSSRLSALVVAVASISGLASAASNKDRIGIGTRKSEEQPPQATETRQFCTESASRASSPGKSKEVVQEGQAVTRCSSLPVSRTSEEARMEVRKIERSPDN